MPFAPLFISTIAWAAGPTFDILFDEPPDRTAAPVRWPVTVGVPFANGTIRPDTPIALTDAGGQPVPVQTKTLGEWRVGARTPKWVLLDFQTDVARNLPKRLRVRAGKQPAEATPISIQETPEMIAVDTGAVSFWVSKKNFNFIEGVSLSDRRQVLKGSALYWVDAQGRRYEARAYGQPQVVLEKDGPLRVVIRAEGWYAPVDGADERLMRYQVRIAAFAGLPYLRIYHTLIWTEDDSVTMREFGLSFSLAQAATAARVGMANNPAGLAALGRVEAVQEQYDSGRLLVDGHAQSVRQLSGWAEVGNDTNGLAVSVKDLAMQVPKALTLSPDEVDVQLWAPQAGAMSMKLYDRVPAAHREALMKNEAWQEWRANNQVVSPLGAAKTHEIWIWPTAPQQPSVEAVNDLIQHPVVAMANPTYQCGTDAIPYLRPKSSTPAKYRHIETALDAMFRHIVAPIPELEDYSLWSFGDVHLFAANPWRTWDNGGYNWPAIPWMLFYRSGERDYLEAAVRNARHVMDVDVCHHGARSGNAYEKVAGWTYAYSPWHWAWGPVGDVFWTHPEYLAYCYYLTGYERAEDVLRLMAEANRGGPFDATARAKGVVSREVYGAIEPKTVYYEVTGDPLYLEAAKSWAQVALLARAPDGKFVGNTFWGWIYSALDSVHRLAPAPSLAEAMLKIVDRFAAPPANALTAPGWDRNSMKVFAFAYRVTGNSAYLRYPVWRIQQHACVTQTDGAPTWSGGIGYSSMERTVFPPYLHGALTCLGAWADAGFKTFPEWPGNNSYFVSSSFQEAPFATALTMWVKKDDGRAGALLITFKQTNLQPIEAFEGKRLEVRVTGPDGGRRVMPLKAIQREFYGTKFWIGPDPVTVSFSADDPAGEYRVDIVSEQPIFWVCPKTDLPGLVVHQPEGKLGYIIITDPSRYFFRLKPGVSSVGLCDLGPRAGYGRPVALMDPSGKTLRLFGTGDPANITVEIPSTMRNQPLSLLKGPVEYYLRQPAAEGVIVEGAYEFFAVNPNQWFRPQMAKD